MRRHDRIVSALIAAAVVTAAPNVGAAPAASTPVAPAADWDGTFEVDAVGSYLGDAKANVMVVGATAVSEPAAESLRRAMRASKKAGLVMDAQAIGATEGQDDRSIVERAKGQPVGQIAIVRVFDGGPGEPPSAIVTFYKPDGSVATAITAAAGTAIARNTASVASTGVSTQAADAISAVGDEAEKEDKEEKKVDAAAQAKYDAEYLWFEHWIGVSAQSGAVVARWSNLKHGKYGADVRGPDLYKITGRDDLLKRYRTRHAIRLGVGLPVAIGGLAMMTVGAVALVSKIGSIDSGPQFGVDDPLGQGRESLPGPLSYAAAGALAGTGFALMMGGMFFAALFKSHPIKASEAVEIVDKYNQGLRKKYGLREQANIRVAPSLGPQNAGMMVGGRF